MNEPDDEIETTESVTTEVPASVDEAEDVVAETEAEPDAEAEAEPDAEPDAEADAEPDAEAEAEPEAEPEAESDAETEAETESEAETEAEAESEAESASGSDVPNPGPSDDSADDTFTAGSAHPAESIEDEPLAGDDTELRPGLEKAPPFVLGLAPLKSAIESLIFVSDKPLTDRALADLAHATIQEVRMAAFELQKEYDGRGIELHQVAGGYQFRSSAKNAPFVRALVAPKPVRLSRALLETLSIVAYRQPVTRPEIDDVRGVDSGEALKALAERDLVRILGRKEEPGRPLLYGTTKHFLEFFGLNSLRDLPTLREYAELTDESRSIFERRMGEPLDLHSVQAQADAAVAAQHAKMSESGEDDGSADDEDDETDESAGDEGTTPDGAAPEGAAPDAPATETPADDESPRDDEREADDETGEERPAEDEE